MSVFVSERRPYESGTFRDRIEDKETFRRFIGIVSLFPMASNYSLILILAHLRPQNRNASLTPILVGSLGSSQNALFNLLRHHHPLHRRHLNGCTAHASPLCFCQRPRRQEQPKGCKVPSTL